MSRSPQGKGPQRSGRSDARWSPGERLAGGGGGGGGGGGARGEGGEVEWLEAGSGSSRKTPAVTAIRLGDMNFSLDSPFVRRLGWLGAVPRLTLCRSRYGAGGPATMGLAAPPRGSARRTVRASP